MQVLEDALSRVVRLDPSLNVFCVVVAEAHVHVVALDKSCEGWSRVSKQRRSLHS